MIIGIGCDIVNMDRLNKSPEFLERFLKRIAGQDELPELLKATKHSDQTETATKLAKIYAAKEAFVKALGTGFRDGIYLSDIQVLHNDLGKPYLKVSGKAETYLQNNFPPVSLSLSISDDYPSALAFVIIESK